MSTILQVCNQLNSTLVIEGNNVDNNDTLYNFIVNDAVLNIIYDNAYWENNTYIIYGCRNEWL